MASNSVKNVIDYFCKIWIIGQFQEQLLWCYTTHRNKRKEKRPKNVSTLPTSEPSLWSICEHHYCVFISRIMESLTWLESDVYWGIKTKSTYATQEKGGIRWLGSQSQNLHVFTIKFDKGINLRATTRRNWCHFYHHHQSQFGRSMTILKFHEVIGGNNSFETWRRHISIHQTFSVAKKKRHLTFRAKLYTYCIIRLPLSSFKNVFTST